MYINPRTIDSHQSSHIRLPVYSPCIIQHQPLHKRSATLAHQRTNPRTSEASTLVHQSSVPFFSGHQALERQSTNPRTSGHQPQPDNNPHVQSSAPNPDRKTLSAPQWVSNVVSCFTCLHNCLYLLIINYMYYISYIQTRIYMCLQIHAILGSAILSNPSATRVPSFQS